MSEPERAAWYIWTYESRRSEKARSRYYFVTYSRFPTIRLWVEDLVKDVAKTAMFRYELKVDEFIVLLYSAPAESYGMGEMRAWFKVKVKDIPRSDYAVEIKSATFIGPESAKANYEWQIGMNPLKVTKRPPIAPKSPDIVSKATMFAGGGMAHHQYPRVVHTSHLQEPQATHYYAKTATKHYAKLSTRRMGLPSSLPSFSTAEKTRSIRARKVYRDEPTS